jgi:hypothetical protein
MTEIVEDYSPIWQNDTQAYYAPKFVHKDKSPFDLTNCTVTLKMELVIDIQSTVPVGTIKTCAGNFAVGDAINGQAFRRFQAADVNCSGVWALWTMITDVSGNPVHADDGNGQMKRLTILPVK